MLLGHPSVTAIIVLLFGMAILAITDVRTREVDGPSTGLLAIAVVLGVIHDGVTWPQILAGFCSAAGAFLIFLTLGVFGRMGGGDVRLMPIPAFVLGAVNPLLALWSMGLAISVHSIIQLASSPRGKRTAVALPFVPAMFAGALGASIVGLVIFS